jgi:hypothetical protein
MHQRSGSLREMICIDTGPVGREHPGDVQIVLHDERNTREGALTRYLRGPIKRLFVHGRRDCVQLGVQRQCVLDSGFGKFRRRHLARLHQLCKPKTVLCQVEPTDV